MSTETPCVRIWTRETVPERFRHLLAIADDANVDEYVIENTVFIAHVPQQMLADRVYLECNGPSGLTGWHNRGNGLWGTNCVDSRPHPDGDGILVIGSDA